MTQSMNPVQLRAFVTRLLDAAPHESPTWASFCREQRDRAFRSAAFAAAALATAGCGGNATDSPETGNEPTRTGGQPSTGGSSTGGLATGGSEAVGGTLYGIPYDTGGGSGDGTGGTGGEDAQDTGGLWSGGSGGLGLGGTLYGTGGLVESGGMGGTGGTEAGGTGGAEAGGTGGFWSGGSGGLGLGGTVYGIGGLVESGGAGGFGLGGMGTAYGIPYEYDCQDGYDDDMDGLTDCQDPDCISECGDWSGCDAAGDICTELVLDTYLTANPDCLPASSSCDWVYPCGSNCPIPDPSQAAPPSGSEWEGCTEDGFAVCGELVNDAYFDDRPQCEEAACGDGPFFPCAPICSERTAYEYPAGSSDNWDGCVGNGIAVCRELVTPVYFENHPVCIPNDTCVGDYFACNEICPPPTGAETP